MPTVSSFGSLAHYTRGAAPFTPSTATTPITRSTASPWAHAYAAEVYGRIYAAQPEVRTCVDFLSRNMAQLGLHVYRRVSDTDRVRLYDHQLATCIAAVNEATTRYRFVEAVVADLAIYFNAYWLKVRDPQSKRLKGLVRMPPETVIVDGWLMPQQFIWTGPNGEILPLAVDDVVFLSGYNPNGLLGISPIETLRCRLAEAEASTRYRANYWDNAARMEGVIERPLAAPRWNKEQKAAFTEQWQARYGGPGNAGRSALLDEGMTFKPIAHSAHDSEYVESRKLTRTEVAAEYHIPPPMVGDLEHATFSNIREQHKQLYQDTLGPWCVQIEEEFDRQLLPEFDDVDRVYVEFNISEKLKGSFEEQANAIQVMCGRPIMTANEGRARLNLPSITNDPSADQLALPLNVGSGVGQPPPGALSANGAQALASTLRETWRRQQAGLSRVPAAEKATAFTMQRDRFDRELAQDLDAMYRAQGAAVDPAAIRDLAASVNDDTGRLLSVGRDPFAAVA